MHNSCILTSSEAVKFAWIKNIFTFNEKSTENWSLPSENRLWNQFCHGTNISYSWKNVIFLKDTYCKVESREVHLRISRFQGGLKALTKSLSSFKFRFNFTLHSEKDIDTYSNFKVCINWLTWAFFIIWIYKQAQCKGHHVPLCAVVVPPTDGNILKHLRSPKIWTIATKTKVRISRSINCKLW